MLIVNFFAGPGAGKSTTAAQTFGYLKMAGVNCELVNEFAKDLTWDGATAPLSYQPYVFGQQAWRLERLRGKVDVVVTDSPLLLTLIYAKDGLPQSWADYVTWEHERDPSLNFLLRRVKPYVTVGRGQSREEAEDLDDRVRALLGDKAVPHTLITSDGTAPVLAFAAIIRKLGDLSAAPLQPAGRGKSTDPKEGECGGVDPRYLEVQSAQVGPGGPFFRDIGGQGLGLSDCRGMGDEPFLLRYPL